MLMRPPAYNNSRNMICLLNNKYIHRFQELDMQFGRKPLDIFPGYKTKKWTVIREVERSEKNLRRFECECECGTIAVIHLSNLMSVGTSNFCKLCAAKSASIKNTRHGLEGSPIYLVWRDMKQRCYNEKNASWKYYGARGIKVCDRWNKFENFFEDMSPRPDKYQLDRIDNEKGYEPNNCRWVSCAENNNNRRNSKKNRHRYIRMLKEDVCENCIKKAENKNVGEASRVIKQS